MVLNLIIDIIFLLYILNTKQIVRTNLKYLIMGCFTIQTIILGDTSYINGFRIIDILSGLISLFCIYIIVIFDHKNNKLTKRVFVI